MKTEVREENAFFSKLNHCISQTLGSLKGGKNQNINYEHKFEGGKKALFYQALESIACLPSIFSVDANIDCLK